MSTTTTLDPALFEELADAVGATLLQPGDDGYEAARRVHNGLVDRRPALIVRCQTAEDAAAGVRFARASGLSICVRGGGHNVSGHAVADDAVMIDLEEMRAVTVDAAARTVRAAGGVTWAELNEAAAEHGLAVTGGFVSTTGIAGLTLGGGFGWLMGKHGFAADNLLAVELVTADSRVVDVDEESDPDLFWALRGGGGNFGVATSFLYRLHPLETVVGGLVAHPFDHAQDVLRFFRKFTTSLPDELTVVAGLVHAPDGSGAKLAALVVCHSGDPAAADRDLAPLLEFGSPAMVNIGPMPYPVVNTLLDEAYPRGALNYWKSSFVRDLNDGFIDAAVGRFASTPSPMTSMGLEQFHGAVTRVPVNATAIPHREPGYNLFVTTEWLDPAETDANVAWTRETYAALEPFFASRRYVNYLDDDDSGGVRAAYGSNYDRLVELKRRYDPDNVFHHNQNIDPA